MSPIGFVLAMAALTLFVLVPLTRLALRRHPSAADSPTFWGYFRRAWLPQTALGVLLATSLTLATQAERTTGDFTPADPRFLTRAAGAALAMAALGVAMAALAWVIGRRRRAT